MEMTQLAPNLFVGPQIVEYDLAVLAREGFTDVVCNRPDEEHPEGAPAERMAELARGFGLAFHYDPITPGEPFAEQADRLAALVARPDARVFAYCRSGMRASNAWSLTQADQSVGQL